MSTVQELLTAEEYFQLSDKPERSELVRGVIVPMNRPGARHGYLSNYIGHLLQKYLDEHDVGWVLGNDAGIIVEREPDTVRGPDVCFFSNERMPELPILYPAAVPNVVFEVRSPTDRWNEILEKTAEYLTAGVDLVCVLVPETREAHLFRADRPTEILTGDEILPLPAPLNKLELSVSACFGKA